MSWWSTNREPQPEDYYDNDDYVDDHIYWDIAEYDYLERTTEEYYNNKYNL